MQLPTHRQTETETAGSLKVIGPTDRVYGGAPPETTIVQKDRPRFTMERENFVDVVVWNPWEEGAASMGDFEPKDGWKNMVELCVLTIVDVDLR